MLPLAEPSDTWLSLLLAAPETQASSVHIRGSLADVDERKTMDTEDAILRFLLPKEQSSEGKEIVLALSACSRNAQERRPEPGRHALIAYHSRTGVRLPLQRTSPGASPQ